jgi:GTP cyclohydrolase II
LTRIRVLTNHPKKVVALEGYGLEIADQVALGVDTGASVKSHQSL